MLELLRPVMHSPEAMLFLTVALGVGFGRLKLGGFSFGNAAGTLIIGTTLGALMGGAAPDLSPTLKSVAFLLFVFAVGFQSGPQFFSSLGRTTLPLAVIALVVTSTGLASAILMSRLFGFDQGSTIGLAAGGLSETAMLGTAYGALNELGLSEGELLSAQGQAAVAFALTYVFGTIGVILFCSQLGPRLIGVNLKEEGRKFDSALSQVTVGGGQLLDVRSLVARAFRVDQADGETIGQLRERLGTQASIQRARRRGKDLELTPDTVLKRGDLIALQGYRPAIVRAAPRIGKEVVADELVRDLLGQGADVVLAPRFAGKTLSQAVAMLGESGRGVFLRGIKRQAQEIPVTAQTVLVTGDILSLAGTAERLDEVLPRIGESLSTGKRADISFLAAGLFCGALIGLATLTVDGLPITLSTGGGALVAGLLFGWWHARHPERHNVPVAATQIMWDFGLATFCALVGLTAGPQAVAALAADGVRLLVAGVFVTLIPQLVGLLVGHFVLKVEPILLFGALAGAQTQDAAMLAASDVAESSAPALGFTVPYAIGNILLTIMGPVIVALT